MKQAYFVGGNKIGRDQKFKETVNNVRMDELKKSGKLERYLKKRQKRKHSFKKKANIFTDTVIPPTNSSAQE